MDIPLDEKPLTKLQPAFYQSGNHPPSSPQAYADSEKQVNHAHDNLSLPSDFDPCSNAKPSSPFYLYNHDPPRRSSEQSSSQSNSIHVKVHDLEAAATLDLTPSSTTTLEKLKKTDTGRLRLWPERKQCMTKPKQRRCQFFRSLPRWQRLLAKVGLALLIVGAMVGIGIGISIKVHGGVYQNQNQQKPIGGSGSR